MSAVSNSLLDAISHYQRNIERSQNNERGPDTERILHCIEKLYKLPINVEHLQETGIGKTINGLRKYEGDVGLAAKALVTKWKTMVAIQECEEHKTSNNSNDNKSDEDDFNNDSNFNHVNQEGQNNPRSNRNDSNNRDSNNKDTNKSSNSSHKGRERGKRSDKNSNSKQSQNNNCGRKDNFDSANNMTMDSDDDEEKLVIVEPSSSSSQNKSSVKTSDDQKSPHGKKHSSSKHQKESLKKDKDHSKHESSSSKKDRKDCSSKHKTASSREDKHKISVPNDGKIASSNKNDMPGSSLSNHKNDKIISRPNSEDSLSNDNKNDDDRHNNTSTKSRNDPKDKSRDKKSDARHANEKNSNSDNNKKNSDNDKKNSHSDKSKGTKHHKSKRDKDYSNKRCHSNEDENSNNKSKSKVPKIINDVEIDSTAGTSFEEALGMMIPAQKMKHSSKSSPIAIKSSTKPITVTSSRSSINSTDVIKNISKISNPDDQQSSNDNSQTPPLLTSTAELKPLDLNILSDLGTVAISNNYKPMPLNPTIMECVFKPVATVTPTYRLTDDEALQHGISSKTIRTKVYSGIKTGKLFQPAPLFDVCIRVLQRNIDWLEYTGGVPFEILKNVLERASPAQLSIIEEYNPYLLEDSDCLWEHHVHRCYRTRQRKEMESFREMFLRCKEEQDVKLDALTKKVKNSQTVVALPVRKTQLAYIDSMVKPPRNILRKQEQFGTSKKLVATPAARVAALNNVIPNATKIGDVRLRVAAHERDTAQVSVHQRPKKAPLMAKSLQLFKGRRR